MLWVPSSKLGVRSHLLPRSRWEYITAQSALHALFFFPLLFPCESQVEAGERKSWVCLWLALLGTVETLLWNCGQTFVPLLSWLLYFIFKHKLDLPGIFVSPLSHRKENPRANRNFWEQPIQRLGKSMEYFESDIDVIFPWMRSDFSALRNFLSFSLIWFS